MRGTHEIGSLRTGPRTSPRSLAGKAPVNAACTRVLPHQEPAAEQARITDEDSEWFMLVMQGHAASKLLWAAVELDLFGLLSRRGSLTREQIATGIELGEQSTRVLLLGLTSLRLLRKRGVRYANAPLAEQRLVREAPGSLVPLLGWQHDIVYPGLSDLTESLRRGRNVGLRHFPGRGETLYERLASDPRKERVFQDAMSCLSRQANGELAAREEWQAVKHVVDAGGGDGSNALELTRAHDHLVATVFDSDTVIEAARRNIRRACMEPRVRAAAGDFWRDPFPPRTDGILLAHILSIWSPARNRRLLRKCFDHLPPGGKLFIFNMVSRDDETGPLINALGSPYFQAIATGEGMLYSGKDYEAWLREAGFCRVTRRRLSFEHALFVAEKA